MTDHLFTSPAKIQAFLDSIPYSVENANRCPVSVLRDRVAHCLDGALFAAFALRRLGYPPRVVDLLPVPERDEDHVLAVYQLNGRWGCIAKSNYVGLRYREAVYLTLRELVMSFFEVSFNVTYEKTLRAYTRPLDLSSLDRFRWEDTDAGADEVEHRLSKLVPIPLINEKMAAGLSLVDEASYRAGTLIANPEGLYQPGVREVIS